MSKTYWGGMPFWFRRTPERSRVESLALRTHDLRQVRGLYWTSEAHPPAKIGVVVMHPRVDFTHHYTIPRLLAAGVAVLAANTRYAGNDTMAEHEEMLLDVGACIRWLKEKRGIEKVVLLGNCGGGSLSAYYQAQARLPPSERVRESPGGSTTHFDTAPMIPADGMVYVAAHRGQGKVLLDAIDPAVVDEADPLATDASLDMYLPENGFREPPAASEYAASFVGRYRAAQVERVARLDAVSRAAIARQEEARRTSEADPAAFAARSLAERTAVLRCRAFEPVMVVYRTMANPHFVDLRLDPSEREYGSLLSERPDLMNMAALGFARTCTPRAWLSTWSGASSRADLVANVRTIAEPTLVVHAGGDREIYPRTDVEPTFAAVAAGDKRLVVIEGARHYFEPDLGEKAAPHVEKLMDVVVPWILERYA